MKVSAFTIAALKNFMGINNSIIVDEPGVLKTQTVSGHIIAVADIEEQFPNFAIYDLSKFVPLLTLLKEDVEFQFDGNNITITSEDAKIEYRSSHTDHILNACRKSSDYKGLSNFNGSLKFTKDMINTILQASKMLNLRFMKIDLEDGKGKIKLVSDDGSSPHVYDLNVEGVGTCSVTVDVKDIVLMSGDYEIHVITGHGIKLQNTDVPLFYIISAIAE